jgi:hypothetical protein
VNTTNFLVLDPNSFCAKIGDFRITPQQLKNNRQYQIVRVDGWFDSEAERNKAGQQLCSTRIP